jgi:SAM-dependent methyltransferase
VLAHDREAAVVLTDEARSRIALLGFDFEAAPKRPVGACNLCGGTAFESVAERDRYRFPAHADLCSRCGLVFLNPMLTAEAYEGFYREVYRPLVSAYHGRPIDAETVEQDQRAYADELVSTLEPFLGGGGRATLLDVGGSTGVVAEAVGDRFGLRATVVDPAPAEAERAAARGLETVVATIEGYDPGGRAFDVVLLCQTIDHLLDVAGSLAKLRATVAEGGLLFVDVVDFRVPMRRTGRVEDAIKVDHPYSLTPATGEAFLARAGFTPFHTARASDGLHVGYVCEPADPQPEALPDAWWVEELHAEIGIASGGE